MSTRTKMTARRLDETIELGVWLIKRTFEGYRSQFFAGQSLDAQEATDLRALLGTLLVGRPAARDALDAIEAGPERFNRTELESEFLKELLGTQSGRDTVRAALAVAERKPVPASERVPPRRGPAGTFLPQAEPTIETQATNPRTL